MSSQNLMWTNQQTQNWIPHVNSNLQRKCACGQHNLAGGECTECSKKRLNLQRFATDKTEQTTIPTIVHDVLQSQGQPLDPATLDFMGSRFGHDFSQVRVHSDSRAARSAEVVNAKAYTVQQDVVFGEDQYKPDSSDGQRLMAHELAHVVQQNRGSISTAAETRADEAAESVTHNQAVSPEVVGGAFPGLYTEEDEGTYSAAPTPEPTRLTRPSFSLGWSDLARIGTFELTPPSLLAPPPRRLTLGSPLLSSPTSPTLGVPGLPPPRLSTFGPGLLPPSSPGLTLPASTPSTGTEEETSAPSLPSRLPVLKSGSFSLGLRLGFPELDPVSIPGMSESALAVALQRATIMNQILTGNVPSGWEAVDKGKLVKSIWGIFSTNIAPDLARSITSGLSTPAGPAGTSFELDLVLLTDFSSEIGGGLSFTVRYPSLQSLISGRP